MDEIKVIIDEELLKIKKEIYENRKVCQEGS